MSNFYKSLSTKIVDDNNYSQACNDVFESYIYNLIGKNTEFNSKTVKKLSSAIQYFKLSNDQDLFEEGSVLLSMLLQISGKKTPELVAVAENLFIQSGDFPNAQLLRDQYNKFDINLSFIDEIKNRLRINLNTIDEINHPLTDYQRTLWEDLTNDNDVITSAPTSAGKTHIILNYLMHRVANSDGAFAAIVVPTRALISEIARKIYEISRIHYESIDIEICTFPKDGTYKDKTFFVMTQERLFETLQSGDIYFDFLFIDEAHNISDNSRGVLLHLTLQKLLEGSNPQIITSMPSSMYQNAFDSVLDGIEFSKRSTKHSPVSKIMIDVSLKGRNIRLKRLHSKNEVTIKKEFKGTKLADIVYRLGKTESNIVYRNKTNNCEDTANDISNLIPKNIDNPELEDAANYVETFLHEDFSLANNLRKGVAFHYGPLPSTIRTMIEFLTRQGDIKYIVCTSTLAEGINLPSKNLFLQNPMQIIAFNPSKRLEDVKLNNITGRAGRMLKHFSGNIFLIDYDNWDYKDYFDTNNNEADKIPTYFRELNNNLESVIDALHGKYSHEESDQYLYYTIANKLLKEYSSDDLNLTLNANELQLSKKQQQTLESVIKNAYESLRIDRYTLEANPSIGFLQQNKLYKNLIEQENLQQWVLPHPKSTSLYDTLLKICNLLYETGIFIPKETKSLKHLCIIARKWMTGEPLKEIISKQIEHDSKDSTQYNCNKSVRTVIKLINNDIRFRLSNALKCYDSLINDVIRINNVDAESVKLYSYIEAGGCDDRVLNLINFGVSREIALEIDALLPNDTRVKSIDDLKQLYKSLQLNNLHEVSKREIKHLIA
ncbi:MAG: DEAD/DEAH box helicase [Candidatus Thiodiazotropha sp.]